MRGRSTAQATTERPRRPVWQQRGCRHSGPSEKLIGGMLALSWRPKTTCSAREVVPDAAGYLSGSTEVDAGSTLEHLETSSGTVPGAAAVEAPGILASTVVMIALALPSQLLPTQEIPPLQSRHDVPAFAYNGPLLPKELLPGSRRASCPRQSLRDDVLQSRRKDGTIEIHVRSKYGE
jgi:hypothetical protein